MPKNVLPFLEIHLDLKFRIVLNILPFFLMAMLVSSYQIT